MSLAVFLPLLLSLLICLVPVWLLRRQDFSDPQDYYVSAGYTPPEAIRNSSVAHALRLAAFGPFFAFGVAGDFWPVIVAAACGGLGTYLIYLLRRPILDFLAPALSGGRSITVHEFIARQSGDDARVRLFAASLTLFALVAAVACETFALFEFFKLVFGNETVARGLAFGILLLALLYAIPAGHPGVMYSGQLQLGAIFLGLFGTTALLLYLHVSALTPLPQSAAFAVALAAVCCLAILIYRRSRYIETGPIDPASPVGRLLSRFGKVLNPVISIFLVLIVVLAGMEFSAAGFGALSHAVTALAAGSSMPLLGLAALVLLPLFYPLADIVNWQRLAAIEKNREAYAGDTARWQKALRGTFRIYAAESLFLWLFIAFSGAIATAALAPPPGVSVMSALVQEAAAGDNPIASGAFSLLLVAIVAIAVSTMASSFSAGLCTIRYDMAPAPLETRSGSIAVRAFFLAILIALILAAEMLPMTFTSSSFLALIFALCCPPLSFAPLLLVPMLAGQNGIGPGWALAILGAGAASTLGSVIGYAATGNESWLWAAAPACLGAGFALFAVARLGQGSRMR